MWDDFLSSDYGQWLVNTRRYRRRLYLEVQGIEPRRKGAMPDADAAAFQGEIREQLRKQRRRPFRGPVVLRLRFQTTDRNPGHIHTITKNFLDLLGRDNDTSRYPHGLLYNDDRQVCGLAVSCEHGASNPSISICARSLGDFRQDLGVALDARDRVRSRAEDDRWTFLRASPLAQAQEQLLRSHRVRIADLAYFYRASSFYRFPGLEKVLNDLAQSWERDFLQEAFRIIIGEPPQEADTSIQYRQKVRDAVRVFREQFSRLLTPLVVPVALEVVVKPPALSRARAVHDLDNLLRNYLIPSVIELFQPPSNYLWALDRDDGGPPTRLALVKDRNRASQLPKSSAIGLIRIEAWRISRSLDDGSPGFVSLAIVADDFGLADSISAVDHIVDEWTDNLRD
jgi:hypothetical protein